MSPMRYFQERPKHHSNSLYVQTPLHLPLQLPKCAAPWTWPHSVDCFQLLLAPQKRLAPSEHAHPLICADRVSSANNLSVAKWLHGVHDWLTVAFRAPARKAMGSAPCPSDCYMMSFNSCNDSLPEKHDMGLWPVDSVMNPPAGLLHT